MFLPKLLFIFAVLSQITCIHAQTISVSTSGNASTCNSNTFVATLTAPVGSNITNGSLIIDYPDAAVFQNPNGYTVNQPTPGQIEISGITITAGSSQDFTYQLYFPCDMISPQQDINGTYIPYEITTDEWHLNDSGGSPLASETNFTYLIDYPNIIGSYTNDPSLSTLSHAGQTITRFIEFANKGTTAFDGVIRFSDYLSCPDPAAITNITLELVDGSGTPIGAPLISAAPTVVSSTQYELEYDFSSSPLPVSTTGNPVSLRITETVEIIACPFMCNGNDVGSLVSTFDLQWGCQFNTFIPPNSFPATTLAEAENLCKSINIYQATIDRDNVQPAVRAYRTDPQGTVPFEALCMSSPDALSNIQPSMYTQREFKFVNEGLATAYALNIVLREYFAPLYPNNQDLVFYEEIELLDHLGNDILSTSVVPSQTFLSTTIFQNPSECTLEAVAAGMTPVTQVSFTVDTIAPGDTITLRFKILRCCPRTENYFNNRKYFDTWEISAFGNSGAFGGGFYSNECAQAPGATVTLWGPENAANGLYQNNHPRANYIEMVQEDITLPGDMTGGANATCNYDGTRNVQILTNVFNNSNNDLGMEQLFASTPNGTVNAELKVVIALDQGLLLNANFAAMPIPDASQVSLINPLAPMTSIPAGYVNSTASSYGIMIPSGATGSLIECVFDLSVFNSYTELQNFMENSLLNFPLTPCCPSYMDEPAGYKVDWYLNLSPNAAPCPDCWIPMSSIENEINIHCPGCVTPGIIVDQLSVKRTNFGYVDLNENGLIDTGISAPMTSSEIETLTPINARKTMPGDNVELLAHSYFQDGDNGNDGFDYETFEIAHGVGALDKLYLDIRIPCGDENVNLWNIVTQEISIDNGMTWLDISAQRIDPVGIQSDGQYFYSIPDNFFGASHLFNTGDNFDVRIVFDICKNDVNAPEVVDCEIACLMWLAGGSTMGRNAFETEQYAPVENGSLVAIPPATSLSASDRAAALNPYMIFNCENFSTEIKHYRFYEKIESKWDNRGEGSYWNQFVCRKKLTSTYGLKLGDANNDYDFFKYEYRPLPAQFVSYKFPIPPFYDLETTDFKISSRLPWHVGTATYTPALTDISAAPPTALSLSEGIISYNYGDYMLAFEDMLPVLTVGIPEYSTNNLFLGDEFWLQNITVYFNPKQTCDTLAMVVPVADGNTVLPADLNVKPSLCDNLEAQLTHNTTYTNFNHDQVLFRPTPNLIATQPIAQFVQTNDHCFTFTVSNLTAGLNQAENTYIILQAPAGMTINSVTQNGNSITSVNGVFQLGTFATFGSSVNSIIEVCFDLDDCSTGQLVLPIRYGYGCTGYPPTIQDQGCWENTINVTINPATTSLNAASENNMQDNSISPCGQAHFEVCTDPTENGDIYDLYWSITLPTDAQLASDVVITYTPSGQSPQTATVLQANVISGQIYMLDPLWELTSLNDELCIAFDYTFAPGCSPNIGTPPSVELGGTAYCGDNVSVNPLLSPLSIGSSLCSPITASGVVNNAQCGNGGAIDLTVSGNGPFTFSWTGPSGFTSTSEDLTGLSPGNYTVTITDSTLCPTEFTFVVGNNSAQEVTLNETACDSYTSPGGTFTSSGVYSYTQLNPDTGCLEQVTLNLTIIDSPSITNPGPQTACDRFNLPLITGTNLTGGQGYYDDSQSNGGQPISGTITTTQTVWIYDTNGPCSDEVSFLVSIFASLDIINPGDQIVCASYTLPAITGTNLTGNEGYYDNSQLNGGQPISGPITTTQTVWIYDANGPCSDEESFLVTIIPSPDITNPGNQTACASYTLPTITGTNLTGNEGYYDNSQLNGGQPISGPITTTQTVWIYDANDICQDEESFTVEIIKKTDIKHPKVEACGSYVIPTGIGAGTVITNTGIYPFSSGAPDCITEFWQITINTIPIVSVTSISNVLCNGDCTGEVTVSAGPGTSHVFSLLDAQSIVIDVNYTGTFTNLCAGNYTIEVSEHFDSPCTETISFTINEPSDSIELSADIQHMCEKNPIGEIDLTVIGGTAPYTYSWTGGSMNASTEDLFGVYPGVYSVTVTDANGCQVTQDFTVELLEVGSFDFQPVQPGSCIYELSNLTLPLGTPIGSSAINVISVTWTVNGVIVGNTLDLTYDFVQSGVYTVCVTLVMELDGVICENQLCKNISVDCMDCTGLVDASFIVHDLVGTQFGFSNSSSPASPGSYIEFQWDWGDGQQTNYIVNYNDPLFIPVHQYNQSGIYEVCLVLTEYFSDHIICSDTVCQTIATCRKNPIGNVLSKNCGSINIFSFQSPFSTLVNFSANVNPQSGWTVQSYDWYFGYGNAIGSGQSTSHLYPIPPTQFTDYEVTLIVTLVNSQGGTCTICRTKRVKVKRPIQFPHGDFVMLIISPNPSNGNVTLKSDLEYDEQVTVVVSNQWGSIVYNDELRYQKEIPLDLSNLQDGMYFVELYSDTFRLQGQMVIIK